MGEPPCYAHLLDADGEIRLQRPVEVRRVYTAGTREGGTARVLVDGIWPRGVRKEELDLDAWFKDLAPSDELRRWFGHDPEKWPEFRERYRDELQGKAERLRELAELASSRPLVLLYSARDERHNQAIVLRDVLEEAVSR